MKNTYWIGALLASGLLCACSSTTMYKVQAEPGFQNTQIHKVLIISLSHRPEVRNAVEKEFVEKWRKRGTDPIASNAVLPAGTPLQKPAVAAFAKAQGYDTVLVSRLLGVQSINPQIVNESFDVSESTADTNPDQYFKAVVASPEYAENYQIAAITATVYQVSSEKKVWTGVAQVLVSKDKPDLPAHINDYVKTILNHLYP